MKEIITGNTKQVIQVDDRDFEHLSRYKWTQNSGGYAATTQVCIDGKKRGFYLHRFLLLPGEPGSLGRVVHHIDNNPMNNQRKNLKICSQSENMRGACKQRNTRSGYRGVEFSSRRNRWIATLNLGHFDTPEEAAVAWNAAQIKLFGDLGQLNRIESETSSRVEGPIQSGVGTPTPNF